VGEAIKFKAQFKFLRDFPFGKCCFFAKKTIENKPFREFMADWKFPSKAFLDLLFRVEMLCYLFNRFFSNKRNCNNCLKLSNLKVVNAISFLLSTFC
jgi:hypothetical protein